MADIKFTFSAKVANGLKGRLSKEIQKATESSPELRKEIARVFQQANRRIQNVQKTGLYSPAVAALGKQGVKGYSKFAMSEFKGASNWTALKEEYGKAVAFLQQPTSSAAGTREFNKQIQEHLGIDDETYKTVSDYYTGKLDSLSQSEFVARYMQRYHDFVGDFEEAYKSSASQLESEAKQISDALQENINEQADKVANETDAMLQAAVNALFDGVDV